MKIFENNQEGHTVLEGREIRTVVLVNRFPDTVANGCVCTFRERVYI